LYLRLFLISELFITCILSLFTVFVYNVYKDKVTEYQSPYTLHIVQTHTHGLL
jgi:hypothetical protein